MSKCQKIRYRDRIAASLALSSTQRKDAARRQETRTYRCPDCKGWHLTSARKECG